MIKILEDLDIAPFLECYNNIEKYIQWSEFPNGKQAGLQYRNGNNPWTDAVGKTSPDTRWTTDVVLNDLFKGTVFESIIEHYNLTRTRFMWIKPYCCYSMHRDLSPRFHIPLITNPDCYFVFKEEGLTHMEIGHAYWVDTTKEHSFMNCSKEWRLHLLGRLIP
jgi:Aspartyl/Asparaginyl beta-hydroxylase